MTQMTALFIDDDDISSITGRLERKLKENGITLNSSVFNLGNDKYKIASEADPNKLVLDVATIKKELKSEFMDNRYDLVACDFNFLDDKLNGFKLIKWIKNCAGGEKLRIRNAKYVLYSSEKGKSLKEAFTEDDMGDLIRLKLDDFVDRSKVSDDVATLLFKSGKEININKKFVTEMEKFGESEFKSVYPKFIGKKINEIMQESEKETHHGIAFQHNLIELTVAHMIELNS